eukprot:gnl/TRDRNA2_/TRDRNA2_199509_c0_seq1.p1 gnl/TRDRNA2_/TRDRNA2_199509_c0~~gnl/TRDRNA2_/TRDRNA2_199509_c0_seq1.p1  ORF type:complete len:297 (-),score=35.11 gnl/TRDRNA2_/TRDRNA2_199509_c0_seq1:55-945(-)
MTAARSPMRQSHCAGCIVLVSCLAAAQICMVQGIRLHAMDQVNLNLAMSSIQVVHDSGRPSTSGADAAGSCCYAMVRSPPEDTTSLLFKQLNAACDRSMLFSHDDVLALQITKAYSKEEEVTDVRKGSMHHMILGIFGHLSKMGILQRAKWIVKVDSDSFVRPSFLRAALQQYETPDFRSVVSVGNADTPDGFFVAVPRSIAVSLYKDLKRSNRCSALMSGHNNNNTFNEYSASGQCIQSLQLGKMVPLMDKKGHHLVLWNEDPHDYLERKSTIPFAILHPVKEAILYQKLADIYL